MITANIHYDYCKIITESEAPCRYKRYRAILQSFLDCDQTQCCLLFNEDFDYNLYWYTSVSYDLLSVTSVLFCVSRFVSIILSVRLGVTC